MRTPSHARTCPASFGPSSPSRPPSQVAASCTWYVAVEIAASPPSTSILASLRWAAGPLHADGAAAWSATPAGKGIASAAAGFGGMFPLDPLGASRPACPSSWRAVARRPCRRAARTHRTTRRGRHRDGVDVVLDRAAGEAGAGRARLGDDRRRMAVADAGGDAALLGRHARRCATAINRAALPRCTIAAPRPPLRHACA